MYVEHKIYYTPLSFKATGNKYISTSDLLQCVVTAVPLLHSHL